MGVECNVRLLLALLTILLLYYLYVTKHDGSAADLNFRIRVGTVSHKLSSLSPYDLSYDLSGPTTRDPRVVE